MRSALVLGVNGQDGSYVAEHLLQRGYAVTGVARQYESRWVNPRLFRYTSLDIGNDASLTALLESCAPDEIYHFAAIHGAAGHVYDSTWREALAVNVGSVHTCLEYIREHKPSARLIYPSSLKAFGDVSSETINEDTVRRSDCLYSVTKNAATELIHYYRNVHKVWASVGYYFNHDSPRRPNSYFLPRLTAQIAEKLGILDYITSVDTLNFWCDWGSSQEYMELTVDLMQVASPTDVIFATGQPVYAATLAYDLSLALGIKCTKVYPSGKANIRADVAKLVRVVGRAPQLQAFDVAAWILRERYGVFAASFGAVVQ